MAAVRYLLPILLLAGCSQAQDTDQLDRIESQLNRIEAKERQLPAPMTKEQYDQMPVGTEFLAPDGTVRRKL